MKQYEDHTELDHQLKRFASFSRNDNKRQKTYEKLQNNMAQQINREQRTRIFAYPLSIAAALLILIVGYFLIEHEFQPGPSQLAFLAEDEINQIEELDKFKRDILLPTYAPFEIIGVEYDETYLGDIEIVDSQINQIQGDDPDFFTPAIIYYVEGPKERFLADRFMSVSISLPNQMPMETIEHYDEEIQFGDGLVGKYIVRLADPDSSSDFTIQELIWEQNGVIVDLFIRSEGREKLPKEEIIKIAESFRSYNNGEYTVNQIEQHTTFEELVEDQLNESTVVRSIKILVNDLSGDRPTTEKQTTINDEELINNILADFSGLSLKKDTSERYTFRDYMIQILTTNERGEDILTN
ncbi:MAG: hypothetical protein LRY73_09180 [Bacillus sp. (in: Bacteria)]|nr:hypothetical protein [Bacillus sp. (in: firmicutes)]